MVFLGAALLLEVGGNGRPGADYQPPRIEGGKIKAGEFTQSQFNKGAKNISNLVAELFAVQTQLVRPPDVCLAPVILPTAASGFYQPYF